MIYDDTLMWVLASVPVTCLGCQRGIGWVTGGAAAIVALSCPQALIMILHPEDHIGLIAVAIKKWCDLPKGTRWQDTEEWSAAAEGLILGCRTYRISCGWAASTWLCWQMRSKLRILQVARRRYNYKQIMAQRIHTQRAGDGVLDERPDEEKEWVASLVERLPWQERSVICRGLHGQMRHRIAGDMGLDEYQVVKIRRRAYAMLRAMIEAES